jgi:predicted Zn-dependent peptidase
VAAADAEQHEEQEERNRLAIVVTIEVTTVPSGLTVVSESMPHVGSVALGFWVGVGSRDEAPETAGASHFLEHLLFKGTSERSAREIAEVIDAVGGEMNAFTAKDHTAFYVRVLAKDLELALDVLSDIMWDPAFRAGEVDAERQVILEELLMRGDDPEDLVQELLAEALYPGHALGREVLGTEDTVRSMSADDLRRFHSERYRPGAMVFAAAGAIEHEAIVTAVTDRLSRSGRPSGGSRPIRTPPGVPAEPFVGQRRPTEQAHLALALPGVHRHHPDRFAVAQLAHILGGGVSSRLFQEVRERRGLAYSVYAYRVSYDDAGALVIYAGTSPKHATEVLDVLNEELARMASGVSERELEVARGGLVGSMALGLEDSGARMSRIGRSLLVHGRVHPVEEVVADYLAVTADDVARVARDLLGGPRTLGVVGPFKPAELGRMRDYAGVAG